MDTGIHLFQQTAWSADLTVFISTSLGTLLSCELRVHPCPQEVVAAQCSRQRIMGNNRSKHYSVTSQSTWNPQWHHSPHGIHRDGREQNCGPQLRANEAFPGAMDISPPWPTSLGGLWKTNSRLSWCHDNIPSQYAGLPKPYIISLI